MLLDPERKLARSWNVRVLPASYVIAPDGTIRFRAEGEIDWGTREVADRKAIHQALTRSENNISSAAKLLGISRPTLYDLIKQYQLGA
ncbi:Bacterial regulatory protein, Fis family [compost metagenome]